MRATSVASRKPYPKELIVHDSPLACTLADAVFADHSQMEITRWRAAPSQTVLVVA
jgi:hypothetical protein